jgi:crotonobetaine/carnitine-CoA ligase
LSPFVSRDVRWLVDVQAARHGSRICLIWEPFDGETRSWSYAEFAQEVRRFAAGLVKRGVRRGDRILVHMDNAPEFLFAWLGCGYAGAVAVSTNTKSSRDEIAYSAAHSRAVAGVTQAHFADLVAAAAPQLSWLAITGRGHGADSFNALLGDAACAPQHPCDPMAPFGIQYTSGTTARPKAVVWTHANALWGGMVSAAHEDLRNDDVHLIHLPLFHTNAQCYSALAALWVGATIVLVPRFSASRFWDVSLKRRCTWTAMIPFCCRALSSVERPERHAYRLWGNAYCAAPTDATFAVTTIGWWGMTETVTHGIIGDPHHPQTPLSMGRPAPEYEIRVEDGEGDLVTPGETGDLFIRGVRGVSMFLEYADNPEATAAAFRDDGYFVTGDRVRLGEEGALYFADRGKDMLKVGGENVAASEIERVIAAVRGVLEVAVVAKPHPMLDEVPVAFIIPNRPAGNADDLARRIGLACNDALAAFKQPHEIRFVSALPRSTLEKVAKAELRAILAREAEGAPGH